MPIEQSHFESYHPVIRYFTLKICKIMSEYLASLETDKIKAKFNIPGGATKTALSGTDKEVRAKARGQLVWNLRFVFALTDANNVIDVKIDEFCTRLKKTMDDFFRFENLLILNSHKKELRELYKEITEFHAAYKTHAQNPMRFLELKESEFNPLLFRLTEEVVNAPWATMMKRLNPTHSRLDETHIKQVGKLLTNLYMLAAVDVSAVEERVTTLMREISDFSSTQEYGHRLPPASEIEKSLNSTQGNILFGNTLYYAIDMNNSTAPPLYLLYLPSNLLDRCQHHYDTEFLKKMEAEDAEIARKEEKLSERAARTAAARAGVSDLKKRMTDTRAAEASAKQEELKRLNKAYQETVLATIREAFQGMNIAEITTDTVNAHSGNSTGGVLSSVLAQAAPAAAAIAGGSSDPLLPKDASDKKLPLPDEDEKKPLLANKPAEKKPCPAFCKIC